MKEHQVHGPLREAALEAMQRSALFAALGTADREIVLSHGRVIEYAQGEEVMRAGAPAESFLVILKGRASVLIPQEGGEDAVEISVLEQFDAVGEMGLLLSEARTASVVAAARLYVLEFDVGGFQLLLERVGGFAQALCRVLARRLTETSRKVEIAASTPADEGPSPEVVGLLPAQFIERQQVLPLRLDGDTLTLGFVHDPSPRVLRAVQQMMPGVVIRPVRVAWAVFDQVLRRSSLGDGRPAQAAVPAGLPSPAPASGVAAAVERTPEEQLANQQRMLFPLLKRMLAEGASDIHLSAGQQPRWRIDGEIQTIADARELGEREVFELLEPSLVARARAEFDTHRDVDFNLAASGIARFRANMYEDGHGISAVLRLIPLVTPNMTQLGLPRALHNFCRLKRGLILVTGHTGCGKSTTLASMIDQINQSRPEHIVTLEDPIEFIHPSAVGLVNQREIGIHADSFGRALRAAMRQDPDVVLVGEMRDLDTVRLAIETANTGHLVLATLHTNSAVGSIDRMIDLFPSEERDMARSMLADVLQGIVTQTLCKRKGGGRVAAFEVFVMDSAIAAQIRQGKTHQIGSALMTGRSRGNQAMNEHLHELVRRNVIAPEEAMAQTIDTDDMKKRLSGG